MRAAPAAAALSIIALLIGACGSVPTRAPAASARGGAAIARYAAALIGTPYHFGGADAAGFDCSGLVRYVHGEVGLVIPRTAAVQRRVAEPVPLRRIQPGDVVFFRIRSRTVDHVGIYAGGGRFIHAPRAGRAVAYARLDRGFYARHLIGAGRFWAAPAAPVRRDLQVPP